MQGAEALALLCSISFMLVIVAIPFYFFIFRKYSEVVTYDLTELPDWEIVSTCAAAAPACVYGKTQQSLPTQS